MFLAQAFFRVTYSRVNLLLTTLLYGLLGIIYLAHPSAMYAQSQEDTHGAQDASVKETSITRESEQKAEATPRKVGPEAVNGVPAQASPATPTAIELQLSATPTIGEGQTGYITATVAATFTKVITVSLGYIDGLTTPADYMPLSSQIVLAPGQQSASIPITVTQDNFFEGNEALMVSVTDALDLSFSPRPLAIRLIDDDPSPALSAEPATVTEGRQAEVLLQLTTPTERDVTLLVNIAEGTAGFGTDFVVSTEEIKLTGGVTTTAILVEALADQSWEPDETASLNITIQTANAPKIDSSVLVTIYDDFDNDLLSNCVDPDDDNDGILDRFEMAVSQGEDSRVLIDTDSDAIPDMIDLDSDSDGIADRIEAGTWRDGDKDGIPDHSDLDRDGDGATDAPFELLHMLPCFDASANELVAKQEQNILKMLRSGMGPNRDNVAEYLRLKPQDSDKDGVIDSQDIDDDGDGLLTINEAANLNQPGKSDNIADFDGDGVANYLESDTGIVHGYVWHDLDDNGIQKAGEPPAAGVKVSIYLADTSSGPSEDLRQRTMIATTVTDEKGLYQFNNLPSESYVVDFVAPEGNVFTKSNRKCKSCNDAHDSDPVRVGLTQLAQALDVNILPDSEPIDLDAGLTVGVTHVDYLFREEPNNNGEEWARERAGDVKLILEDGEGREVARAVSDPNGAFTFKELTPGVKYTLKIIITEDEAVVRTVDDPSLTANLEGEVQTASGLPVTHHYQEQWG